MQNTIYANPQCLHSHPSIIVFGEMKKIYSCMATAQTANGTLHYEIKIKYTPQ